ncbi:MAG: protein disulfide oxidoreductase [Gallionellaceae bacterium]|jgi:thiol-disulfide isomerase/thioredoxin
MLIAIVVFGIRSWQQRDISFGAAPALPGITWRQQATLVHFWADWCPICKAEQSSIQALADDYPNTVTIAMQSGNQANVDKFMREQSLNFAVINDPDGSISRAWGVHAVPASFIVDTNGQIRFVEFGYTTELGLRLRLWLAQHWKY